MQILFVASELDPADIQKKLDQFEVVAIRTGLINSIEEFMLAEHLAKQSFANKKNIANKFKYEFLLWLTGKRDIKSAINETKPDGKKFIVVMFSADENDILAMINAKKLKLKIERNAKLFSLEKISLSRLR